MRKPRNPRYKLKAYYIENDTEKAFWCKDTKMENITNEMGQSFAMANGEHIIETDSPLNFKINKSIKIGNETLLIQNKPSSVIDDNDLKVIRGKTDYITTFLAR